MVSDDDATDGIMHVITADDCVGRVFTTGSVWRGIFTM